MPFSFFSHLDIGFECWLLGVELCIGRRIARVRNLDGLFSAKLAHGLPGGARLNDASLGEACSAMTKQNHAHTGAGDDASQASRIGSQWIRSGIWDQNFETFRPRRFLNLAESLAPDRIQAVVLALEN